MIRAVIACGGEQAFAPCRQAIPVGIVDNGAHARRLAAKEGWSSWVLAHEILDLCPACTSREQLRRVA